MPLPEASVQRIRALREVLVAQGYSLQAGDDDQGDDQEALRALRRRGMTLPEEVAAFSQAFPAPSLGFGTIGSTPCLCRARGLGRAVIMNGHLRAQVDVLESLLAVASLAPDAWAMDVPTLLHSLPLADDGIRDFYVHCDQTAPSFGMVFFASGNLEDVGFVAPDFVAFLDTLRQDPP